MNNHKTDVKLRGKKGKMHKSKNRKVIPRTLKAAKQWRKDHVLHHNKTPKLPVPTQIYGTKD